MEVFVPVPPLGRFGQSGPGGAAGGRYWLGMDEVDYTHYAADINPLGDGMVAPWRRLLAKVRMASRQQRGSACFSG